MKHLLNGVAIAAVLAIAAPAWAQNAPMTPSSQPKAAPAAAPAAPKQAHHRPMRHKMATHSRSMRAAHASSDDAMTNQLNREELARIQSGGGAPAPAPAPGPGPGPGAGPGPAPAPAPGAAPPPPR